MLLVTRVCARMDRWDRLAAIKAGIVAQTIGVLTGACSLTILAIHSEPVRWSDPTAIVAFAALVGSGLVSSLGATMMDIAVAQDWLPTVIPQEGLAAVNSRLRQIDLGTELTAPIIAGVLLSLQPASFPLAGFLVIAVWNLISFFPEFKLLQSVYRSVESLANKPLVVSPARKASLISLIGDGWRDFRKQPAAGAMFAYTLLWVTILSPHGVLLAGWLKSVWQLPETAIGAFRGLGAVFGLASTWLFPLAIRKWGLIAGSRSFITFQAICLLGAGLAFRLGEPQAIWFIVLILCSRIGLYGFMLGETQIRQTMIDPAVRGKVNGFGSAMNSMATLAVYGAGTLVSTPEQFSWLIYGSIAFVVLGALTFFGWSKVTSAA